MANSQTGIGAAYTTATGSVSLNDLINIVSSRPPSSSDSRYQIGKVWSDTSGQAAYILVSKSSASGGVVSASWQPIGGGSAALSTLTGNTGGALSPTAGNINIIGGGALSFAGSGSTLTGSITPGTALLSTLTGDSGGARSPTAGNINILGTPNQITTTGASSNITLSLPSAVTFPGSAQTTTTFTAGTGISSTTGNIVAVVGAITAGTSVTATLGNVTATAGNFVASTVGTGVAIKSGVNARIGTVSLVDGAATVANSSITANTRIFLAGNVTGGTPGFLRVSTISVGVSFDITSSSATDSSLVVWLMVESIP